MVLSLRAVDGACPWNRVNALVKLSGESYPYFIASSMTVMSLVSSSSPASASLRFLMYSVMEYPHRILNPL